MRWRYEAWLNRTLRDELRAMNIVNTEETTGPGKGDVTGPGAADHAKVTTGDVRSGDTVTNTTVDNSVTKPGQSPPAAELRGS